MHSKRHFRDMGGRPSCCILDPPMLCIQVNTVPCVVHYDCLLVCFVDLPSQEICVNLFFKFQTMASSPEKTKAGHDVVFLPNGLKIRWTLDYIRGLQ